MSLPGYHSLSEAATNEADPWPSKPSLQELQLLREVANEKMRLAALEYAGISETASPLDEEAEPTSE